MFKAKSVFFLKIACFYSFLIKKSRYFILNLNRKDKKDSNNNLIVKKKPKHNV